jgi:hypothetical protein
MYVNLLQGRRVSGRDFTNAVVICPRSLKWRMSAPGRDTISATASALTAALTDRPPVKGGKAYTVRAKDRRPPASVAHCFAHLLLLRLQRQQLIASKSKFLHTRRYICLGKRGEHPISASMIGLLAGISRGICPEPRGPESHGTADGQPVGNHGDVVSSRRVTRAVTT